CSWRPRYPIRLGSSAFVARGIDCSARRGLGCVRQAVDQVPDRFLALGPVQPHLVEPLRAGVACGVERRARAVLHPPGRGTDEPGLGLGAGEQGSDQRPGGDAPGKRQQRRLAERIGRAPAGALISLYRPLARGRVISTGGTIAGRVIDHCVVLVSSCLALAVLRPFRFSPTSLPARSISGSRARNIVTAATTPVAAKGRARTASTVFSARSAPFSFAPCQVLRASVLGLSRSCSSCAVAMTRARLCSASARAEMISGVSFTGRASSGCSRTNRAGRRWRRRSTCR